LITITMATNARYPALLWVSAGCALLGAFSFGFQIAILNASLDYVSRDIGIDADARGAVVSSAVLLGALLGALGAGSAADRLGPKTATLLNALPLALNEERALGGVRALSEDAERTARTWEEPPDPVLGAT
jgi:MFS family permease